MVRCYIQRIVNQSSTLRQNESSNRLSRTGKWWASIVVVLSNSMVHYIVVPCSFLKVMINHDRLMKEIKIGFLQLHNTADVNDNIHRLQEGIRDLAHRGAQLIVLQELHNSLYFCQVESVDNFDLAEPIPGPSTALYGALAKELGVVIVTSLFSW